MKTKIISIVILALISLGGCKSVKQAQKDTVMNKTENSTVKQSQQVENLNVNMNTEEKQSIDSSKNIHDKGSVNQETEENIVVFTYSAPNAEGKQFIVSQTKTIRVKKQSNNKNLTVSENVKNEINHETELRDQSKFTLKNKENIKIKSDSKSKSVSKNQTENKTPGWVYFVIFIISLIASGLIYVFLKKFNLMK